ncbi:hypothetical protein V8G54_030820 [Vigna mungo]|uniref:Uncharacterized protein n=1 Tax=Vigna mungo TaxID=3915 RepID=A0AAQ3MXQ8_VIGMU
MAFLRPDPVRREASGSKNSANSWTIPDWSMSSTRWHKYCDSTGKAMSTQRKQHLYLNSEDISRSAWWKTLESGWKSSTRSAWTKELEPPTTMGRQSRLLMSSMMWAARRRKSAGENSGREGSTSPRRWWGTPRRCARGILLVVMSSPR